MAATSEIEAWTRPSTPGPWSRCSAAPTSPGSWATNSDNEGLAVLPDGDYLVSSETEPSIRIYSRDGRLPDPGPAVAGDPDQPAAGQLRGHDHHRRPGLAEISLISDDNFSPTQFTRVLNLAVKLP